MSHPHRWMFPVLALGLALPGGAIGKGTMARVPQDFATIQEAVDGSTASRIQVTSGSYEGAEITRRVDLRCSGNCSIDVGVPVSPVVEAGLVLTSGASGSYIGGFVFNGMDLGIYSSCSRLGSVASGVEIAHNTFLNNAEAVVVTDSACAEGDGWVIHHNEFQDIRADISNCGGGLGVFAINVRGISVAQNTFTGTLAEPPCGSLFSTAAIFMSGVEHGVVIHNDVRLDDGEQLFKFDVALFGFQPGGGPNSDMIVANNDFRGSDAPFFGVHLASFDGDNLAAQCNFGTTLIDHSFGDGDSEFLSETNCHRRDIRPSDALSRPYAAFVP